MATLIREHSSMFVCSGGCHLHRGGGSEVVFCDAQADLVEAIFTLLAKRGWYPWFECTEVDSSWAPIAAKPSSRLIAG